jgi:hypothetical protein
MFEILLKLTVLPFVIAFITGFFYYPLWKSLQKTTPQ